jgi:hypothetical protein
MAPPTRKPIPEAHRAPRPWTKTGWAPDGLPVELDDPDPDDPEPDDPEPEDPEPDDPEPDDPEPEDPEPEDPEPDDPEPDDPELELLEPDAVLVAVDPVPAVLPEADGVASGGAVQSPPTRKPCYFTFSKPHPPQNNPFAKTGEERLI